MYRTMIRQQITKKACIIAMLPFLCVHNEMNYILTYIHRYINTHTYTHIIHTKIHI